MSLVSNCAVSSIQRALLKICRSGEMSDGALQRVLQPKALGAWNLHLATKHLPLDHFVLFSSISVLVGNSKQANYCAANGFWIPWPTSGAPGIWPGSASISVR